MVFDQRFINTWILHICYQKAFYCATKNLWCQKLQLYKIRVETKCAFLAVIEISHSAVVYCGRSLFLCASGLNSNGRSLKKDVLYLGLDSETPHYSSRTRTFPWITLSLGPSQQKTLVHAFMEGVTLLVPLHLTPPLQLFPPKRTSAEFSTLWMQAADRPDLLQVN